MMHPIPGPLLGVGFAILSFTLTHILGKRWWQPWVAAVGCAWLIATVLFSQAMAAFFLHFTDLFTILGIIVVVGEAIAGVIALSSLAGARKGGPDI
jgi:hypothetical protein